VETTAVTDTSPLGAAALAAQAANGGALVAPDAGPLRMIEPRAADRQAAEAAYARYRRLFDALAPMYRQP
jgi:sugar (pentulose or hexulose) kinase